MHTLKVIFTGLALLGVFLLVGRWATPSSPATGLTRGALWFLPLWLVGTAINMWIGVKKAGYSVQDEAPVCLVVFAVPALLALLIWWRWPRA